MTLSPFLKRSRWLPRVVLLIALALPAGAAAQMGAGESGQRLVQIGPAALPGLGAQAGYILPRSFYTLESTFYANISPQFAQGEGNLLVSGGIGGALRILGAITTLELSNYEGYQLDVGLRFGPAVRFILGEETLEQKNTRARLFLEPFSRFAWQLDNGQILFAEIGTQRPFLRGGLWVNF